MPLSRRTNRRTQAQFRGVTPFAIPPTNAAYFVKATASTLEISCQNLGSSSRGVVKTATVNISPATNRALLRQ